MKQATPDQVLRFTQEEVVSQIEQTAKINIHLAGEVRTTDLFEKKNGKLVYWSPFTGKRMEFHRQALNGLRLDFKPRTDIEHSKGRQTLAEVTVHRIREHVGDSFVAAAASIIAVENFPLNRRGYGVCFHSLITNCNLKTAGYESGAAAEIDIGRVFEESGALTAIEFAVSILRKTKACPATKSGCGSVVERETSTLETTVQFRSPAPKS